MFQKPGTYYLLNELPKNIGPNIFKLGNLSKGREKSFFYQHSHWKLFYLNANNRIHE